MIEGLSRLPSVRSRHTSAPLLKEREQFLQHLSVQGICRVSIRMTAAYLLHIVRIMALTELRNVTVEEIEAAGQVWAAYVGPERRKSQLQGITKYFILRAKQWFTFNGSLAPAPLPPFSAQIELYADAMRVRGLSATTIYGYRKNAATFLQFVAPKHSTLETIRLSDVYDYLAKLRASGKANKTIATQCHALRSFFTHAEIMGWCVPGIPLGICSPRVSQYRGPVRGPAWKDVRRLVQKTGEAGPKELRTRGVARPPRLHDLRYTFAVHRLTAWHKRGADLNRMIPALSVYMGYMNLSAAARFLSLTPERFRAQLNKLSPRQGKRRWRDNAALMHFLSTL
jgi:integrase/recombinase XerD